MLRLRRAELARVDDRGWVLGPGSLEDFGSGGPRHLHLVSVAPGAVRGNHYHELSREHVCLMGSRAKIAVVDLNGSAREEAEVSCAEPLVLTIEPGVIHAIKNVGDETLFLLCCTDRPYDAASPDVVRRTILE